MTRELTQQQAIETYSELMRRVSVGAYIELEHDGSYPPDDGSPESTTLESLDNLTEWAAHHNLEFSWDEPSGTYTLIPMTEETKAARQAAQEYQDSRKYMEHYYEGGEIEGDGSGLHQCPYCYNLVNEEHEEFCPLNPNTILKGE